MNKTCSHGKTWDVECRECDAVWTMHEIRSLIADTSKAADFFEANPGTTHDPRIIHDLYLTIMRLAKIIAVPAPLPQPPEPPKQEGL